MVVLAVRIERTTCRLQASALRPAASDAEGGANVSARQFIEVLISGTLTGMGFATLFIHVMTGGCIP